MSGDGKSKFVEILQLLQESRSIALDETESKYLPLAIDELNASHHKAWGKRLVLTIGRKRHQ